MMYSLTGSDTTSVNRSFQGNFEVVSEPLSWGATALAELSTIWNTAPASDDQLLVWAVADLVFRLERDPENGGESRPMATRVLYSWPLAVWYEVRTHNTVWIRHVWRY